MKQPTGLLNIGIAGGLKEVSTAWAGASVLIELFRKLELDQIASLVLPTKKTAKGLKAGQMVESFILLSALVLLR
jgi:hypothetical protein